jgi:hypothetical protein
MKVLSVQGLSIHEYDQYDPGTGTQPDESAAIIGRIPEEIQHGLTEQDAREILNQCVRDLSGCSTATMPELAFRLMCERLKAVPRSSTC